MNVLLVDDEALLRKMTKVMLQKRGIQVFEAANGPDAIALADQHPIDVLVTDIVMEGMDGWALASSLTERYPNLPIVFCSGYPIDPKDKVRNGACCTFLLKPFQAQDLIREISDLTSLPV